MNQKNEKEDFFSMLLGTLGASLLGNMLLGKAISRAAERFIRVGYRSKKKNF